MIMQRDLKVGLSLGVLVLGIVGALLFRREQLSDAPKATLKSARKIDERIAEGPRTPYMTGEVEFDQEEPNAATATEGETGGRPAHTVPPSWLNDEEDPFKVTRNDKGQFDFPHQAKRGGSAFDAVQPLSPSTGREVAGNVQTAAQTHVIQSGDSLSLLAERYLGSQGRYQEIYDANQGVLTDINRLPLGATIVIPSNTNDVKTAKKPASSPTARTAMGQPEKVRSQITDVSTIEPLAPPTEETLKGNQAAVGTEKSAADTAAAAKPHETKKFVTPTRTPFASRAHTPAANSSRKVLDPEDEDLVEKKPGSASESTQSAGEPRHYQVRKGDSLEKISTKVYGNGKRAADIFAANRQLLTSPDAVREGQELVLPE